MKPNEPDISEINAENASEEITEIAENATEEISETAESCIIFFTENVRSVHEAHISAYNYHLFHVHTS